jgi:ethanolamine ammonia-lyase small subunit
MEASNKLIRNSWENLKQYTDARIALGRAGASIPTAEWLQFKLAHAQAKDAVWQEFHKEQIAEQLHEMGMDTVFVESVSENKQEYLTRPDLGRRLSEQSLIRLHEKNIPQADILIIVGDGLSSKAVNAHAVPVIRQLAPYIEKMGKTVFPVVIAQGARVALGDEIGETLKAKAAIMLIGERPGLSSADSLGIYLTWNPMVGRLDSERNCISNIRPQGLIYPKAAFKLAWLLEHSFAESRTGILLKDLSDEPVQIAS